MGKCNITPEELAGALDITVKHLDNICQAFDADPNDDWELIKSIHFEWGPYQSRIFSAEGAVEICNYLEKHHSDRPWHTRLKRWIFQRDRKLKGLMVAKRVEEVRAMQGQLVFINGRAFLGPKACREILSLGTRQDVLWRTFQEIQKATSTDKEPLKIDVDFFEDPSKPPAANGMKYHYFSRSGLASVGKQLGDRLSQKHRQEWAKVVVDYAPPALEAIEKYEANRQQRIKDAMDRVRRQAKKHCQLTGESQSVGKFDLEVHHLFHQDSYPDLADLDINLIAIRQDIHNHFHRWMGGTKVSCTIDDFEKFIEEFGNSLFPDGDVTQATQVRMRLSNAKKMLKSML